MKYVLSLCLFAVLFAAIQPTIAAEIIPPVSQRFAAATGDETPDFRRHVLPLLGQIGCNGRACHGSFQGQGGFRLSLFGYDFAEDHKALLGGDTPRTDREKPENSLILRKPTLQEDHDGGERMKVGSWQYHTVLRWIKAGAEPLAEDSPEFARLEVTPREFQFKKPGESFQLRVIAHWEDGDQEDVTCISRFRTNDESIAKVDDRGRVTAVRAGDTHVVAFYDNGVVPVQTLLPVSKFAGKNFPNVPTPTKIDELVVNKLRKLGMLPAELCTDSEFLRRVSLDMTGTLPSPAEVEAFLADNGTDKRAKKIDELLERPAYAAWQTTKLCDITGNNQQVLQQSLQRTGLDSGTASAQWYQWIYQRVSENRPYDEIVAGLVTAVSRKPGQTYDDYCRELMDTMSAEPAKFATRDTMPWYWTRQNFRKSEDMALGFCYTFLGIQMQCAQCHKHPFDQWTKQDFDDFTGFFSRVAYGVAPESKARFEELMKESGLDVKGLSGQQQRDLIAKLQKEKALIPQSELFVLPPKPVDPKKLVIAKGKGDNSRRPGQAATTAKFLGAEEIELSKYEDPRTALIEWLRRDPTRYFARAMVNRVWANYFGVGIIDPTDDMNLANPPSNAELLDYLSQEFVNQKYDLKWLHRTITNSHAYQRSVNTNDTNRLDTRNFARATPRRLPAEVAFDALIQATANREENAAAADNIDRRAIGPRGNQTGNNNNGNNRGMNTTYVMTVFGKPPRATNCDCERSVEPSLLQTIYLRNDSESLRMIDRPDGWVKEQVKELGNLKVSDEKVDDLVREAFLRTLSRPPSEEELARSREYVLEASGSNAALRDLIWALVNTKEFIVNH